MIRSITTFFLFACIGTHVLGQAPKIPVAVPANIKQFIPKGYEALDLTTGDLNRDAHTDAILVLYKKGEEKTFDDIDHHEKRPLLVLIGQAGNTYKLAAKTDNAVYCVSCGGQMGDPFMGVTIKNGYFSVEHYGGSGWRWTRIVTFKYAPAEHAWFLFKDGGERFHATKPEEVTTEIQTTKNFGKVLLTKFDIYKDN
jgi:hypothetical protein